MQKQYSNNTAMAQVVRKTGLRRDPIDKFYTKDAVARRLVDLVREFVAPAAEDVALEPSAGAGAFLPHLQGLCRVVALDVAPEHEAVRAQDFFEWDPQELGGARVHVVGNPPFGRQASAAIRFVKKCAEFAASISFVLPRSFKKQSMQRCFPPRFHLLHSEDAPASSFLVDGAERDVPCVLQVWLRRDQPRALPSPPTPRGFRFVRRDQQPHVAVRRVGVNAGAVHASTADKSTQSHYFLRLDAAEDSADLDALLERLRAVSFEENNTVGAKSISKPELIKVYNKVLKIE